MPVTLLGIIVFLHPAMIVLDAVSIIALQSSRESYTLLPLSTFIFVNSVHIPNADWPIVVTLLGMVIEVSLSHPTNASLPMLTTLLGMVTDVRRWQPRNAAEAMLVTLLGMITEVRLLHSQNA